MSTSKLKGSETDPDEIEAAPDAPPAAVPVVLSSPAVTEVTLVVASDVAVVALPTLVTATLFAFGVPETEDTVPAAPTQSWARWFAFLVSPRWLTGDNSLTETRARL